MFTYKSTSPAMTAELAKKIAQIIPAGTVICLNGDLGAGKTLFTQNLAAGLGVVGDVTSPTFNLLNIYEGKFPIFHFDLYRLEQEYELEEIGFFDYLEGTDGLTIIEWADKFKDCLPDNYIEIAMQRTEREDERLLVFEVQGNSLQGVYEEMKSLCQF